MVNYTTMRAKGHSLIRRRGGLARLRRDGVDRNVYAVITDYSPRERGLRNEGARRALVSALDPSTGAPLAIEPDHEQDKLIYAGGIYQIPTPVTGAKPVNDFLYFELEVVLEQEMES